MAMDWRDQGESSTQGGEGAFDFQPENASEPSLELAYRLLIDYEQAVHEYPGGYLFEGHPAVDGLRQAWECALALEDHALAGHILGILEPYLDTEQMALHESALEKLTLGGLRDITLSHHDVEDTSAQITRDLLEAARTMGFTALVPRRDKEPSAQGADKQNPEPLGPGSCTFETLVGYEDEIIQLQQYGIGADDGEFRDFIHEMSMRHGIDALSSYTTIVFRANAREDADQLMLASAAQLDLPTIRMRVDDTSIGGTVLSVIASNGFDGREALAPNGFFGPGVLVLEDIDTWIPSFDDEFEAVSDEGYAGQGFLSRGAQKALSFIKSCADNPSMRVFASMASGSDAQSLGGLLGDIEYFDIPSPNVAERSAIWVRLMDAHPSLADLDHGELVRLSANMARCDIISAAREAVEQAFRESIRAHEYKAVTRDNLLDKVAAYQPLESDEYQAIEDALAADFIAEIEQYDSGSVG